ncbi:MAG: prepilin-type N-terminal cleavage/methylation domain-containing protein [Deltaproteobacteria bacterium]|nr:prepilin-type N-terminal cleavage/methylation domain-containing protein [Deltaproteobacteria bacterium]
MRDRGYTMVEVMMALAVLTIGATGIVAMQRTSLLGNTRARNLDVANAIATTWIERMRLAAVQWTDGGGTPNLNTVPYLSIVGSDFPTVNPPEGVWFRPAEQPLAGISPAADVRGMDTFNPAQEAFCTHLRIAQIQPTSIRVEVRVFYLRDQGGGTLGGDRLCSDSPAVIAAVDGALSRYHFVYAATAVVRNDVN